MPLNGWMVKPPAVYSYHRPPPWNENKQYIQQSR